MVKSRNLSRFGSSLAQLYSVVEGGRWQKVWTLLLLTVAGAFTETIAIGAVVPFLALLASNSTRHQAQWIRRLFEAVGVASPHDQLAFATWVLCVAAILAALLRILLTWKTQQFVFSFGHRLSVELQRRMVMQPYSWHVRHNSSEQLAAIEKAQLVTGMVLLPLVQAAAATVLVGVILVLLLQIALTATVVAGAVVAAAYVAVAAAARSRLERNSHRIGRAFADRIRIVQEGLSGIREVILGGSQSSLTASFRAADGEVAEASANSVFVSTVPRFLVEAAGIIVIAGLALSLSTRPGGLIASLPALGALAVGAQRLLPLIQQLFQGWSHVAANRAIIEDVVLSLDLPISDPPAPGPPLPFSRSIEFRDVSFAYANREGPTVFGLSFNIRHGSRVALVGPTGSGKSTTADLLLGLFEPAAGTIAVDGAILDDANRQRWRANVAHVPQMLFLADASIAENIALAGELDMGRVRKAASLAHLDEFVDSLPDGYKTRVGERGAQISGGQRQRLAIARAIYKDTALLVLDEATNALDSETERAVEASLNTLQAQGMTIVVIAHHSPVVAACDQVLRLEKGRLAIAAGAAA